MTKLSLIVKMKVSHSVVAVGIVAGGWGEGGVMVLGKLSVPRRPTNLDNSRARAYCACSRCGWGLFGHFLVSFLSPSFGDGRHRLKYVSKGRETPKTNKPNAVVSGMSMRVYGCHHIYPKVSDKKCVSKI